LTLPVAQRVLERADALRGEREQRPRRPNKEVAMDTAQTNPPNNPHNSTQPAHVPEKYLIAFVIQGDDVFKITADNIIHTTGTADGPAFDAIAKLKAAAALLELTNRHKERPTELRKMARELAGEGMKLMAAASASIRPAPAPATEEIKTDSNLERPAENTAPPLATPATSRNLPRAVVPLAAPETTRAIPPGIQANTAGPLVENPASSNAYAGNGRIALITN
jgi:hypothetical protein